MEMDVSKILLDDESNEKDKKLCFSYMKWIFPFLAALHARDKLITTDAIKSLQQLISEKDQLGNY